MLTSHSGRDHYLLWPNVSRHISQSAVDCLQNIEKHQLKYSSYHLQIKILHKQHSKVHCVQACPLCGALSHQGLNLVKLVHDPTSARESNQLTSNAFNRLGQYVSSPRDRP